MARQDADHGVTLIAQLRMAARNPASSPHGARIAARWAGPVSIDKLFQVHAEPDSRPIAAPNTAPTSSYRPPRSTVSLELAAYTAKTRAAVVRIAAQVGQIKTQARPG